MRGEKYLKVTGVLMAIFGILGIVVYGLLDLVLGSAVILDRSAEGAAVILITLLYLVWSILYLIAGIYGVKNCDKPEKAKTCYLLGSLSMICIVFVTMLHCLGHADLASIAKQSVLTFCTALLPSFYMYGAMLNSK